MKIILHDGAETIIVSDMVYIILYHAKLFPLEKPPSEVAGTMSVATNKVPEIRIAFLPSRKGNAFIFKKMLYHCHIALLTTI